MKLNAVGITTTDMSRSMEFYRALGFDFGDADPSAEHVTTVGTDGSARLMIDGVATVREMFGEDPRPSNHSAFAVECESAREVDALAAKVREAGFTVAKEPWDAVWGQRYAVVEDPEGYKVDLYAAL